MRCLPYVSNVSSPSPSLSMMKESCILHLFSFIFPCSYTWPVIWKKSIVLWKLHNFSNPILIGLMVTQVSYFLKCTSLMFLFFHNWKSKQLREGSLQTICQIIVSEYWQCHLCIFCGRQATRDLPAKVKPFLFLCLIFSSLKEQEKPGM